MKLLCLLVVVVLLSTNINGYSQNVFDQSKWVDFGLGTANGSHNFKGCNVSMGFVGYGLLKKFNHQIGVNSTLTTGGNGEHFSFLYTCIGAGHNDRFSNLSSFIGPAFILKSEYNSDKQINKKEIGVGLNMNMRFVFKPVKGVGLGMEFFQTYSIIGNFYGGKVILLFSSK